SGRDVKRAARSQHRNGRTGLAPWQPEAAAVILKAAVERIKTGQRIRVDGTRGFVQILGVETLDHRLQPRNLPEDSLAIAHCFLAHPLHPAHWWQRSHYRPGCSERRPRSAPRKASRNSREEVSPPCSSVMVAFPGRESPSRR